MKWPLSFALIASLACTSSIHAATGAASVLVTVKDKQGGKVLSRTMTDAGGKFSTGSLPAASYNLEFRSSKSTAFDGKQLAISVAVPRSKGAPRKASAIGKHLSAGVALNIDVPVDSPLAGTILVTGSVAPEAPAPPGMEKVRANVKVINGRQHVWVPAPIGSNMGGKWVLAGTEGAILPNERRRREDEDAARQLRHLSEDVGPPRGNPMSDRR